MRIPLNQILTLAAQDVPQELPDFWINGFPGFAADLPVFFTVQRIRPAPHGLDGELDDRAGLFFGERQDLRLRQPVLDSAVGDAIGILGEILHQLAGCGRERAVSSFVIRVLVKTLVPLVAAVKDQALDVKLLVILEVKAVDVDWLVCPLTRQTELAPGADVFLRTPAPLWNPGKPFVTAVALCTEDAVELLARYLGQRS